MSTDVEAICNGLVQIHEIWAAFVESAIALWLLHTQLGVAFVAPALVSIGDCPAPVSQNVRLTSMISGYMCNRRSRRPYWPSSKDLDPWHTDSR